MLWNAILLAIRAIRRNVMRSSLTVLGIVIGVAAVIIMVTLGNGATAQVSAEISALGSNLLIIRPGQDRRGPGGARGEADLFEMDDVEAIRSEIVGIAGAAPAHDAPVQVILGNKNWSTTVSGTDNTLLSVRNWTIAAGREFSESELRAGSAVCILGATVREEIFGEADPIGSKIRLKNLSCRVIGLLQDKGQSSMGQDQDDFVMIPLKAFQRRISGNRYIDTIFIAVSDSDSTSDVKEAITLLLRERRKQPANEGDDFYVRDTQELLSTMTSSTQLLTGLLSAVAAVSLLVGGIGIMNIMIVSVTERTSEIGVRLAIGALEHDVRMQFLVEAIVLSSFGGLLGFGLGLAVSYFGANALSFPFVFDPKIAAVAFVFSALVGVLFGYFPAQQASRLDPIEALRHE